MRIKISFKSIITNLIEVAGLSACDICEGSNVPESKIEKIYAGEDCELKSSEQRMLVSIHYRECEQLHSEIIK